MINEPNSLNFRDELAQQLLQESDKNERRELLRTAKLSFQYRVSRSERKAAFEGKSLESSQIANHRDYFGEAKGSMDSHFVSNEASLFRLFPYIEHLSGGILGVGSDQVLDAIVNSECSHGYIVDFTETVSLITRSLLEIGLYHQKLFNSFPSKEEIFEYFDDANRGELERILMHFLTQREVAKIINRLNDGFKVYAMGKDPERYQYTDYLRFKASMENDDGQNFSWYGTQANIDRILSAYAEGRIVVIKGDITNRKIMDRIAQSARSAGVDINVIYLSNVESYLNGNDRECDDFNSAMKALPFGPDAVMLRSSWETISQNPKPPVVASNIVADSQLYDWHYNVQKYRNWRKKVNLDRDYLNNGWCWEVRELEAEGFFPDGISTLG